jgi:hypothetical protein
MYLRHPVLHVFVIRGVHAAGRYTITNSCPGDDLTPPEVEEAVREFCWPIPHTPYTCTSLDGTTSCCRDHSDTGITLEMRDSWASYVRSEALLK